ncbi:unnamed protein product [Ascophyllum nodosum]
MQTDKGSESLDPLGRGSSSNSSASRKHLISSLLGGNSNEAPWFQTRDAPGGASLVGVKGGGQRRYEWSGAIQTCLSGDEHRKRFFQEVISTLSATLMKAFGPRGTRAARKSKTVAPPPLPLAPLPPTIQEADKEPEDQYLRRQDEHYLRELRICLREVLNDLRKDRRFSMFKQIGDYEGEYMDLNGIREKLNAEEYLTLDDFEKDLKLMASEAKEVRDRLKVDLARAEAEAAAVGAGSARVTRSSSSADVDVATGPAGTATGSGAGAVTGAATAVGGGDAERRTLIDVDRVAGQVARASTALDLACFLRDAALSFLQDCVSRLGYDLEGKCKEIAARMKQSGRKAASGGNLPAPNCTSESVIDIYSRFAGQGGPRERSTRASKRSASSDGRLVQLGDNGVS